MHMAQKKYVYITDPRATLLTFVSDVKWNYQQAVNPYHTVFRFEAEDVIPWSDYETDISRVPKGIRLKDIPSIQTLARMDIGKDIKWKTIRISDKTPLIRAAKNALTTSGYQLIPSLIPYWKKTT